MKIRKTTARQRFLLCFLLIIAVSVVGATGFHIIEGWNWFDGIYMTIITMTTVGYGEVHPLSHAGHIFNVILIVASVLSGALLLGTFTQVMLELELGALFGKGRLEREIEKITNHYVICGAGRVGRTVAKELRSRHVPCLIIEKDPQRAEWAHKENIPVIVGSGATEESLHAAHIERARGLIAAVTSDADNLYIVLTASGMRPDLTIIARASEEEAIPKLKRAGASRVLSPYQFIGHRIVQLVLRPNVVEFLDTAFGTERMDIEIEEMPIGPGSTLIGQSLEGSRLRQQTNCIVVALKRSDGELKFNPSPDERLLAGDKIIALGSQENLRRLEKLAACTPTFKA